ncbi:MAG: hypothetical protein AEth_01477 [Candidatus Argoarchaeum ethanivorans]|uniref:Uncharacterized protein n=1 Tax=Candidatus Argoarchaeum ethanivorans TaxID=2608793 RepID=A0A8B3S0Y3_9EURY|nr:MAG: hypothetical protein AEth_01477 [Candidatus Argoarchaeum ethanivorans]
MAYKLCMVMVKIMVVQIVLFNYYTPQLCYGWDKEEYSQMELLDF